MVVAILLPSWISTSLFVHHLETTVAIFNTLYTEEEGRKSMHWMKYSLQDHFTIFLPFVIMNVVSVYMTDFDSDPNKIFYFYSLFADLARDNQHAHMVLNFFDKFLLLNAISIYNISDFMMLSFFSRIFASIDFEICTMRRKGLVSLIEVEAATKMCRRLQIMIQLFNQNFAYITFITKVVCIYGTIVCFYFSIKILPVDVVLATSNLILALDGVGAYILFFDRAFGIPGKMQELKTAILIASTKLPPMAGEAYRKRELQSIPSLGIKVGDFHNFERESTPNFVDFVTRNIIGLLLSFG
ncbi:unnamed protein product [Allacma fusca]|uniref:Uncharacterized protein n=1 Tax=Allacma fusca TaxID=39272 RepID=A0A8J2KCS2_9HEXA|nr:unnamed protein product [Allacma fusca]